MTTILHREAPLSPTRRPPHQLVTAVAGRLERLLSHSSTHLVHRHRGERLLVGVDPDHHHCESSFASTPRRVGGHASIQTDQAPIKSLRPGPDGPHIAANSHHRRRGTEETSEPAGPALDSHGREESRSGLQDLIGPAQFPVLPLQTLETLPLIRTQPRLSALIDLNPPHPLTDRLRRRTQLLGNRNDRLPLRVAMLLSLEHHPNSPIPQLHRILPRPLLLCHDSILSRSGACALLGEVQWA